MFKISKQGEEVNSSKILTPLPKHKRPYLKKADCDGLFQCKLKHDDVRKLDEIQLSS